MAVVLFVAAAPPSRSFASVNSCLYARKIRRLQLIAESTLNLRGAPIRSHMYKDECTCLSVCLFAFVFAPEQFCVYNV